MRFRLGWAGSARHLVDATGKRFVGPGNLALLKGLEGFDRANDRTARMVNGNRTNPNRNFVPGFVMKKSRGFHGLGGLDRASQRAIFLAELATGLLAVQQCLRDT